MRRRAFLKGAAFSALSVFQRPARADVRQNAPVDVVRQFGFVPDGRTDNYSAFHRLADFANRRGGGDFVFPPGEYFVQQYRTLPYGTVGADVVRNSTLDGLDGLTLSGQGARILLNGRFHRSGGAGSDGLRKGVHTVHFMPFDIRRSRNILVQGFEVDGGARDTTRDDAVHEGYAHLIALNTCENVELRDLDLHHGLSDGVYIGDDYALSGVLPGRVCRNVRMVNVSCRNNARGGLAPLHVLGLSAVDCEFSGNGYPGPHRGHAPGFGIDIEPDRHQVGVNLDSKTGNLEFLRCTLNDNHSAILAAYVASFTGYCRFIDCTSRNGNNSDIHMILTWPGEGLLLQGGDHDAGRGCIYTSWQQTGGRTRLKGLTLRSAHDFGLLHGHSGNLVEVEDCEIIATHREPTGGQFIFFSQDPGGGRRNKFLRNRIFIPAGRKHPESSPFDVEPVFHNTDLADNEYTTDLALPGEFFVRHFDQATCSVRNERFRGAFPGREDTIRPVFDQSHDTRLPFSSD